MRNPRQPQGAGANTKKVGHRPTFAFLGRVTVPPDRFMDTGGLTKMLEPSVNALGFELVAVEMAGTTLRLYIDSPEGVTVDDCADVSHQVSAVLDVEDPIRGEYTLEVSSPGLDRPLVKPEDFERFAGERVKVKLHQSLDGRKNFVGRLAGLKDGQVVVETDEGRFELELDQIDRARLVPEF